ncbi:bifunctional diguanylate cyclase/phosphodiesterase [Oxalobacter formigenes OXCC13]|uniref:Diguanylate cyclase (GGDEF) domain protein n=2 Tax=Oxalobacter formigenes TaxID=847 RepID=C3XCC4_OXAFO|nr:putative signaling protein [Oxalobacter formigenes]ARQ77293.1 bifunctional diguanylate cyclase/phosphodiesterase [Oxalobacter formigenes OXCC13]EEO30850.1 diguanylate cyclase (GGDEF) domain protein [Oxalobacter formigenes OXCC13]QDX32172.1 GGDEF domain-containing protein [Oxalobacter formigenes]
MLNQELVLTIMNEIEDLIYVADVNTYDLLYMNEKGSRLFGITDFRNKKCYEALQNRSDPCPFCTNSRLNMDSFYIWEFMNPVVDRYYLLKDKLLLWNGRTVRIEICTDITDKQLATKTIERKLQIEEILLQCIRDLSTEPNIDVAVNQLLQTIGEFHRADRAYIFEFDYSNAIINNTYEWCSSTVTPQLDNLQNVPIELIDHWIRQFKSTGHFYISSLDGTDKKRGPEYDVLAAQNIDSLMATPLYDDGKIIGFLGIDNPKAYTSDFSLLESITYFIQTDVKKRKILQRLEHLSYTDALTGLGNRNKYIQFLHKMEEGHPKSVGIVFLDINGLKEANDKYGHDYGDQLIVKTADILNTVFNDNVFRIGGDEFIAFGLDIAREAFDRDIGRLHRLFDDEESCNVSFGSTWKSDDFDVGDLISYADRLMYINKQSYYSSTKHGNLSYRADMTVKLLAAIKEGEYLIHLQPKVNLKTMEVCAAEALVRRQDATGKLIMPSRFIPFFEEESIIRHIDLYVLENVCKLLSEWKSREYECIPISVNLSRITLMEDGIVEKLVNVCDKYEIPHSLIDIEVTESISKMETSTLISLSKSIKSAGFSLSLDDFGSQYSDFAILTLIDFDMIKIDKQLIDEIENNEKSRILLKHSINICREMNRVASLAEGIETEKQHLLLKEFNCNFGQGYYYSRPVDVKTFEKTFMSDRIVRPAKS